MSIPAALSIACAVSAVAVPAVLAIHAWTTRTGESRLARAIDFVVPALMLMPLGSFVGFMLPIAMYSLGRAILTMLEASL